MGNESKGSNAAEASRRTSGLAPAELLSPRWRALELAVAIAGAILVIASVCMVVRPIGDLYVALAGGRDVLEGRLGKPDDWSFMTVDPATGVNRVWINQNWGTHLVYYLAWQGLGEWGLLGLKGLILAAAALFMAMAARQRQADLSVGVVVAVAILAAGRSYIDLRPNLSTLMLAPLLLWLLYRSRDRVQGFPNAIGVPAAMNGGGVPLHRGWGPHRIWVAAGVVWLWANVHGGFVFGLGMMTLWTICQTAGVMLREGAVPAARKLWPLPAATLAAVLLASFVNPFGFTNLTHPVVVAKSQTWQTVSEWCSILVQAPFGTIWEFLTVLGVVSVLVLVRIFAEVFSPSAKARRPSNEMIGLVVFQLLLSSVALVLATIGKPEGPEGRDLAEMVQWVAVLAAMLTLLGGLRLAARWGRPRPAGEDQPLWLPVFDALLIAVACAMAIKSRRFIPLAMIVMAPFLAAQVTWLFRRGRRLFVPAAAGLCVALSALLVSAYLKFYLPDRPGEPPQTIFQRMGRVALSYPVGAAEFINANGLSGRMFAEWRWEGYLRLRCPQLKDFIGGRAQQVYDEKTYELGGRIIGLPDLGPLKQYDVHLVVVTATSNYSKMIGAMLQPAEKWACVYSDGMNLVFAEAATPEYAELVRKAADGRGPQSRFIGIGVPALEYPDEGSAALSRAMCLASPVVVASVAQQMEAILQAARVKPVPVLYRHYGEVLLWSAGQSPEDQRPRVLEEAIGWLEAECARLERIDTTSATVCDVLSCRRGVAALLSELYLRLGRRAEAAAARNSASSLDEEFKAMMRRWN